MKHLKSQRSQSAVQKALDGLPNAAENKDINIIEKMVKASDANVTHGEICTHSGVKGIDASEGCSILSMSIVEQHLNFLGAANGGALFSLPDITFGLGLRHKCHMLSVLMRGSSCWQRPIRFQETYKQPCTV